MNFNFKIITTTKFKYALKWIGFNFKLYFLQVTACHPPPPLYLVVNLSVAFYETMTTPVQTVAQLSILLVSEFKYVH